MNQIKFFLKRNIVDVAIESVNWKTSHRVTRRIWWLSKLLLILSPIPIIALIDLFKINTDSEPMSFIFFAVIILFALYTQINISVKRFKDIGMSGYLVWLMPIPLVGQFLFFVLGFCHSESDTQDKMTLKKLFLVSFKKRCDIKISKKNSILAFLLSFFVSFNIYAITLILVSVLGGVVSGFGSFELPKIFSYIVVTFSVILSIICFAYSLKLILKRRD